MFIKICFCTIFEYGSDLSNEHYLSSSEFFFFWPFFHHCLGSVHYCKKLLLHSFLDSQFTKFYNFQIFTVIYSPLYEFVWNQHNDQLLVGVLARLVRYWLAIPLKAIIIKICIFTIFEYESDLSNKHLYWMFFSGLIFTTD